MRRRDSILIFFALLLAYTYVLPRWADWSQNSRLNLVRALVERGTVQIDAYVDNTGDYALYEGHAYTDKPPGLSLVGLPLYAVALPLIDQPAVAARLQKLAGGGALAGTLNPNGTGLNQEKIHAFVAQLLLTVATIAIPAAALGVLLFNVLGALGFGRGLRLLVTLGYALATPAAAYAGNYYSHQFVAVLLFGALALLLLPALEQPSAAAPVSQRPILTLSRAAETRAFSLAPARALLFGLLCGYALISEYPIAIAVMCLGVLALTKLSWRGLAIAAVGGALPLLLMVVYNTRAFGTIWPVGYAHSALWQNQHQTGFMSITYPHPEAIFGLTLGSYRGLFFRAPWLLAALPGFVLWYHSRETRPVWWAALGIALGVTLFYSSSVMWWGGFGIGPRYLVPAIPFLAIAAAWGLRPLWQWAAGRFAAIIAVLLSVGLVWSEALARQGFPPDTLFNPWAEYTLPAWRSGDIARNFGTALGLHGALGLLPMVLAVGLLIGLLIVPPDRRTRQPAAEPNAAPASV